MSSARVQQKGDSARIAVRIALVALATVSVAASLAACGSPTRDRRSMLMAEAAASRTATQTGGPALAQNASAPQVLDDATYRLAPGDLIDVKFPYHPEENERVPVRPDGRIGLQSAGDVIAAGMTVKELEQAIVDKASVTLRNPVVSVVIVQLAEHKVYVGGDVAKPGFVQFRDGLTPLEAIIERGGFLDTAKSDQVLYITRAGDQVRTQRIDLEAVIEGSSSEEVVLAPDDILFVPKTWIGEANVFVDQWIRGLLPTVPRPGFDLNAVAF
jgi:protein involved in polysaccharide export with SLBB domain